MRSRQPVGIESCVSGQCVNRFGVLCVSTDLASCVNRFGVFCVSTDLASCVCQPIWRLVCVSRLSSAGVYVCGVWLFYVCVCVCVCVGVCVCVCVVDA